MTRSRRHACLVGALALAPAVSFACSSGMKADPSDWLKLLAFLGAPALVLAPLKVLLLHDYAGLGRRCGIAYLSLLTVKVGGLLVASSFGSLLSAMGSGALLIPPLYLLGHHLVAITILTGFGAARRVATATLLSTVFPVLHVGAVLLLGFAVQQR